MGENVAAEVFVHTGAGLREAELFGEADEIARFKVAPIIDPEHSDITGDSRTQNGDAAGDSFGNDAGASFHQRGEDEVSRTRQQVHGLVVRLIANPLVSGILALLFTGSRLPIRIQRAAGMNDSDA